MIPNISNNSFLNAPRLSYVNPATDNHGDVAGNERRSDTFNSCTVDENTKEYHQRIYNHICEQITARYENFDAEMERGFDGTPGVTADIENITNKDLISILSHIGNDELLINSCFENSAQSSLFDKIYLASNKEQGWNLRLHRFKVGGSGLGGEDSPHFHRWTLASSIRAGGYMNVNYIESEVDNSHLTRPEYENDEYSKYLLPATKDQGDSNGRAPRLLDKKVVMSRTKQEIFGRGDLSHFPINDAHSVDTMSGYMGTTITLAHTGKSQKASSIAYEKNEELKTIPQVKYEKIEDLKKALDNQKAFIQILDLADELHGFLNKKWESKEKLTAGESNHWHDHAEFNYVETSLLPALAIYGIENHNNVPHRDFSTETVEFLEKKLKYIDTDELENIIKNNQDDLLNKKLTIEEDRKTAPEFFRGLDDRKAFEGFRSLFV